MYELEDLEVRAVTGKFEGPIVGQQYFESEEESFARAYAVPAEPAVLTPEEAKRLEDKFGDASLGSQIKEYGRDAVAALGEILLDPRSKPALKADVAKWFLEKISGKASQQVNVESQSLNHFMDLLRQMHSTGETLDVTPGGPKALQTGEALSSTVETPAVDPELSPMDRWFRDNG